MPTESTEPQVTGYPSIKKGGAPLTPSQMSAIAEVVVDLDATRPSMFVLRYVQSTGPGTESGLDFAIGDEVEIGEASSSKTLLKGEVTSIEAEYGNSGQRMVIRGFEKGHRLQRSRKYRSFLNLTDADIAKQIAGGVSLPTGTVESTTPVHKYIVQVNQSDWDFLKWRADENGLVLDTSDGKFNLRKPDPPGPAAFSLSVNETLLAFRPRISAPKATKVLGQAWDELTKKAFTANAQVQNSKTSSIGKTPSAVSTSFGTFEHLTAIRSAELVGDVTAVTNAVADRYADSYIDAEGVAYGEPGMVPGVKVKIEDVGPTFNGEYRITAAKHVFNATQRYNVTLRFTGVQDKSLLALTSGNGNGNPFASSRTPRIDGVVPAIVTNIKDPDARCRIKVKFPWLSEDVETEWARVAQFGAGAGRGWVTLPEVNDEVLVAFEHGDFRMPYIIGNLYNNQDKPDKLPYDPSSGSSNLRGMVSKLGHKLVFQDDGPAKKGIHVITSDANIEIYMNEEDKKITIDCKSGKVEIHGMDDISIKSDKNINIEATQKVSIKGQMGIDINSPQDVSVGGLNAKITGTVGASLSGNATVEVKSSGMAKLQGSLVQIN